ncbi:MAG TPA: alanine--glyoxylate aminotransferase family protein [Gemmatimonadaceae bacterium]|nr:alanine--glyoxylate aminotransferase family protein [Gemmatimonadaceae bacterium]
MSTALDPRSAKAADGAPQFGRFFIPGPTEVRPDVLAAMNRPMMSHRGAAIEGLIGRIAPRLQQVFRTSDPVCAVTSSATGLMEAGVRNAVRARILCLVNGAFSARFHKAAVNSGIAADKLEVEFGQVHTPEMVADALKAKPYDVVTMVHSETSTGALNPIRELTAACHAAGDVVVVIDTVSSMAAAPIETAAWELDYVLTGSQKAFALPPGLAFYSANAQVLERARAATNRGLYFDLLELDSYWRKNQTPNTPALSLLYALDVQLEHMTAEGMEGRWARHDAMARRTWAWVDEKRASGVDIRVLAPEGFRSPAVSCIAVPPGRTGPQISAAMKEKGFIIATGYGSAKDAMIRIGHMGDHTLAELETLLDALTEVLAA